MQTNTTPEQRRRALHGLLTDRGLRSLGIDAKASHLDAYGMGYLLSVISNDRELYERVMAALGALSTELT